MDSAESALQFLHCGSSKCCTGGEMSTLSLLVQLLYLPLYSKFCFPSPPPHCLFFMPLLLLILFSLSPSLLPFCVLLYYCCLCTLHQVCNAIRNQDFTLVEDYITGLKTFRYLQVISHCTTLTYTNVPCVCVVCVCVCVCVVTIGC